MSPGRFDLLYQDGKIYCGRHHAVPEATLCEPMYEVRAGSTPGARSPTVTLASTVASIAAVWFPHGGKP